MKRLSYIFLVLLFFVILMCENLNAQQGIGTKAPSKVSVVEMQSTKKGILIPRVALQGINNFSPINGETSPEKRNSLLVYNTATVWGTNGLIPGYYYWTQTTDTDGKWNKLLANTDAVALTLAGDVTGTLSNSVISNSAVNSAKILNESILNEDISTAAGIDVSKLKAATTNGQVLSTTNGNVVWSNLPEVAVKSADNGLTLNTTNQKIELGGTLTKPTSITLNGTNTLDIQGGRLNVKATANPSIDINSIKTNLPTMGYQVEAPYLNEMYAPLLIMKTFGSNGGNDKPKVGIWAKTNTSQGSSLMFGTSSNYLSGITNTALTINHRGFLGIGTETPSTSLDINGQVKITGGTPGAGKVLTSDATGLASWNNINTIYNSNGNINESRNISLGTNGKLSLVRNVRGIIGETANTYAELFIGGSATGLTGYYTGGKIYFTGSSGIPNAHIAGFEDDAANGNGGRKLVLKAGFAEGNDGIYITDKGRLGVRNRYPSVELEVNGQVKITGGAPGASKVLTSDADGLATWANIPVQTATGTAGGDLTGTYPNPTIGLSKVTSAHIEDGAISNTDISNSAGISVGKLDGVATNGQVLTSNGTTASWQNAVQPFFVSNATQISYTNTGDYSKDLYIGSAPGASGAGRRMLFLPSKIGAFRAGDVDGTQWDIANIGQGSFAVGQNNIASGYNSVAFGRSAQSTANYSFTAGYHSKATQSTAVAFGELTEAKGPRSVVFGLNSISNGNASFAAGSSTIAYSGFETVFGSFNTIYTPINANGFNINDRLFVLGNGTGETSRSNAMVVYKNGNVSIGVNNNPSERLEVLGNVKGTAFLSTSDQRLKTNIKPITNGLKKVMSFKPVFYDKKLSPTSTTYDIHEFGFIAQEIRDSLDCLVFEDSSPQKYLSVNYTGIIPVLAKAIQEQQAEIKGIQAKDNIKIEISQINGAANAGQVLSSDGKNLKWTTLPLTLPASGDLEGTYPNLIIKPKAITANKLNDMGASNGQVLKWDSYYNTWIPSADNTGGLLSDRRLKTNIQTLDSGIFKVMQLNPVIYNKKQSLESTDYPIHELGFIAQEIKDVIPEVVSEDDSPSKIQSVNYLGIIPVLTKAIQEQEKNMEALQAENKALKTQNERFEMRLKKLEELLNQSNLK